MNTNFYTEFDKMFLEIKKLLSGFCRSKILHKYFSNKLETFFYATLINNFFINLNNKNIKEYGLSKGKIGEIKSKYALILKQTKLALKFSNIGITDVDYYKNFKSLIKEHYSEFYTIVSEIEKEIDIKKGRRYLKKKLNEIKTLGKDEEEINSFFITKILEMYVEKKKCLPFSEYEINKIMKQTSRKVLSEFSLEVTKILRKNSKNMLIEQRKTMQGFENRLYKRWKEPIDLLESLIRISLESGETQKHKLSKTTTNVNNFKREALIKIHARALQMSNEILILLKSGYPDGANSRWRSLHELAVISFFLLDENNDVSRRYLEHEIIRKFKEAKDYRANYKKLGYPPIERKVFNNIKREKERLCRKYSDNFHEDYGWIPRSVLSDRNFRSLEKHVKLDKLRPFYNLSCDSVHGGAKGFYRLGLMDDYQDKILHVGASNYGLADPIQNTAISLMHVTICLLVLQPDFENIIEMQIMNNYVNEVGTKAVNVQKKIEKEESKKSK